MPLTLDFDRVETSRLDRLDETLIPALEVIATHFAHLTDDEDKIAWNARQQGWDGKEAAAIHRSNKSDDVRLLIEKALEEARELRSMYLRGGV